MGGCHSESSVPSLSNTSLCSSLCSPTMVRNACLVGIIVLLMFGAPVHPPPVVGYAWVACHAAMGMGGRVVARRGRVRSDSCSWEGGGGTWMAVQW